MRQAALLPELHHLHVATQATPQWHHSRCFTSCSVVNTHNCTDKDQLCKKILLLFVLSTLAVGLQHLWLHGRLFCLRVYVNLPCNFSLQVQSTNCPAGLWDHWRLFVSIAKLIIIIWKYFAFFFNNLEATWTCSPSFHDSQSTIINLRMDQ